MTILDCVLSIFPNNVTDLISRRGLNVFTTIPLGAKEVNPLTPPKYNTPSLVLRKDFKLN